MEEAFRILTDDNILRDARLKLLSTAGLHCGDEVLRQPALSLSECFLPEVFAVQRQQIERVQEATLSRLSMSALCSTKLS
jgi:hypothetical protein